MNRKLITLNTIVLIFFITFSCKEEVKVENNSTPIVIGKSISIYSEALEENRDLMISLPKNYEQNIHSYPVIFVLDAEYLFELTTSIVNLKVSRNEMPESIVIGIPNTEDGRYDMAMELTYPNGRTFFGDATGAKIESYLNFIHNEVLAYVESEYRINAHRTIIGMSPTLGVVFEALWNRPNLFSGYIALAPELAVTTNTGKTVEERILNTIQTNRSSKTSLYIGKASEDLTRRPPEEALAYKNLNLTDSVGENFNYRIEVLEHENHYGMAIRGIENGLETIYPHEAWKIPYRDFWKSDHPAEEIETYYQELSKTYGFKIIPQEDTFYFSQTLTGTLRRLYRQREKNKAEAVLKLGLTYYPNSEKLQEWKKKIDTL